MKAGQLSDENLIYLLQKGDRSSFDELYQRYWKKLFCLAYNKLHSRDLAEEVIQELFVGLWAKRDSLHIESSVSGYLNMAVRYMIIKYFHKEQSRKLYRQSLSIHDFHSNNTEELVNYNELSTIVEAEINKLPEKCREVFHLSRREHLTNKEIASILNISVRGVETARYRLRKRLEIAHEEDMTRFLEKFAQQMANPVTNA